MRLGGVCLDLLKKLLVVGPGEFDPVVRRVYAVEATHRSSFVRPGPIARTASVERDDKDVARTHHAGTPSDSAGNDVHVVWRAWPGSSGARTSSKWFAPQWLARAASGARRPWSWTASPESVRAG